MGNLKSAHGGGFIMRSWHEACPGRTPEVTGLTAFFWTMGELLEFGFSVQ